MSYVSVLYLLWRINNYLLTYSNSDCFNKFHASCLRACFHTTAQFFKRSSLLLLQRHLKENIWLTISIDVCRCNSLSLIFQYGVHITALAIFLAAGRAQIKLKVLFGGGGAGERRGGGGGGGGVVGGVGRGIGGGYSPVVGGVGGWGGGGWGVGGGGRGNWGGGGGGGGVLACRRG